MLGWNKSLSNPDIEGFLIFIQTVPYGGTIYESYVITRMRIYDNQNTKSSMTLTPDLGFATQVVIWVHCRSY